MNVDPKDKKKGHEMGRPIRYRGKGEWAGKVVRPEDNASLTFEHLEDVDYIILRKNGTLLLPGTAPATEKKS